MENTTQILGFAGTAIIAAAYVPQIRHLIKKHCAYGISIKAWFLWFVAALFLLPRAISSNDPVFIALFSIQIVAILFIVVFSYLHQEKVCQEHKHKIL